MGRNGNIDGGIMAHFALIDQTNTVREVLTINNDDCGGGTFPESEPIGQAFIAACGLTGTWLQTSYSASFRGVYAGIGTLWNPATQQFEAPSNE